MGAYRFLAGIRGVFSETLAAPWGGRYVVDKRREVMDATQWAVFREFLHKWVEKNAKEFPAIARTKGISLAKRMIDEALAEWRATREKAT